MMASHRDLEDNVSHMPAHQHQEQYNQISFANSEDTFVGDNIQHEEETCLFRHGSGFESMRSQKPMLNMRDQGHYCVSHRPGFELENMRRQTTITNMRPGHDCLSHRPGFELDYMQR